MDFKPLVSFITHLFPMPCPVNHVDTVVWLLGSATLCPAAECISRVGSRSILGQFLHWVVCLTEPSVEVTEDHLSTSQETQTNYCTYPISLN